MPNVKISNETHISRNDPDSSSVKKEERRNNAKIRIQDSFHS